MALLSIRAQRRTRCGMCDGMIEEGDPIVKVDDEWVHSTCAEDAGEDVMEPME